MNKKSEKSAIFENDSFFEGILKRKGYVSSVILVNSSSSKVVFNYKCTSKSIILLKTLLSTLGVDIRIELNESNNLYFFSFNVTYLRRSNGLCREIMFDAAAEECSMLPVGRHKLFLTDYVIKHLIRLGVTEILAPDISLYKSTWIRLSRAPHLLEAIVDMTKQKGYYPNQPKLGYMFLS